MAHSWNHCLPFCASCSAALFTSMGTVTAGQVAQGVSLSTQQAAATQGVNASLVSLGSITSAALVRRNTSLLSALGASTSVFELASLAGLKARESTVDFETSTLVNTFKELEIARVVSNTAKDYGPASNPTSGNIMLAGSCEAAVAGKKKEFMVEGISAVFDQYNNELGNSDEGVDQAVKAQKTSEELNAIPLTKNKTYSDVEKLKQQEIITMIVNPSRSGPEGEVDGRSERIILLERIRMSKLKMIHNILSIVSVENFPIEPKSHIPTYLQYITTGANIGHLEKIMASVDGRMSSDGWYLEIKTKNNSGLNRELTYLKSEENALLYEKLKLKRLKNNLLAIMAANN